MASEAPRRGADRTAPTGREGFTKFRLGLDADGEVQGGHADDYYSDQTLVAFDGPGFSGVVQVPADMSAEHQEIVVTAFESVLSNARSGGDR